MNTQRLKKLSGMHPNYHQLKALREDRQRMIDEYDRIISEVERGEQLDEGLFGTLRASLATLGQMGAKGAKIAIDKTKEISNKVKDVYADEKSKVELSNMVKNMKSLGDVLYKMAKDSGTIIKKDPEVTKAMTTFDELFKVTIKQLETRLAAAKGGTAP